MTDGFITFRSFSQVPSRRWCLAECRSENSVTRVLLPAISPSYTISSQHSTKRRNLAIMEQVGCDLVIANGREVEIRGVVSGDWIGALFCRFSIKFWLPKQHQPKRLDRLVKRSDHLKFESGRTHGGVHIDAARFHRRSQPVRMPAEPLYGVKIDITLL